MKFITIVVCAYNESLNIYYCLKSLAAIDYPVNKFEVIIIDDDSEDETLDIIKKFIVENKHINFKFYKIKHGGLSIARNTGVKISKNEIILFVDADAIIDKDILNQYNIGFANTDVKIATGKVKNLNLENKEANFIYSMHNYPSLTLATNKIIGANMAFKREIFNKYLFFDFFVSRGDETAIIKDIQKDIPKLKVHYFDKAIVYNETANKITEWLKKMYIEGQNSTILLYFFSDKFFLKHFTILIKFIYLSFYVIAIFSFIIPTYVIIIALLFFILRNFFRIKYILLGVKTVFIRYGFLQSIKSFFIVNLGIMISDIGSLIPIFTGKKLIRKNSFGTIYTKN